MRFQTSMSTFYIVWLVLKFGHSYNITTFFIGLSYCNLNRIMRMRFCIPKFPLGSDKIKAIHQQNKLKDPPRDNPPGTGAHAISTQKGPSQSAGSNLQLFSLLGDSADGFTTVQKQYLHLFSVKSLHPLCELSEWTIFSE